MCSGELAAQSKWLPVSLAHSCCVQLVGPVTQIGAQFTSVYLLLRHTRAHGRSRLIWRQFIWLAPFAMRQFRWCSCVFLFVLPPQMSLWSAPRHKPEYLPPKTTARLLHWRFQFPFAHSPRLVSTQTGSSLLASPFPRPSVSLYSS